MSEEKMQYAPSIFFEPNIDRAKQIILTPEAGMSTDRRWKVETEWLMSHIKFEPPPLPVPPGATAQTAYVGAHASTNKKAFEEAMDKRRREMLVVDYGCGIGRIAKEIKSPVIGVDISPTMRANMDIYCKRPDVGAVSPPMFELLVENGLRCSGGVAIWALQHALDVEWDIRLLMKSLMPESDFWLLNAGQRFIPSMVGKKFGWGDDHVNVFALLEPFLDMVEKIEVPKSVGEPNYLLHLRRNYKYVDMKAPRHVAVREVKP